mgnify:CR=1 FL=1
MTYGSKIALVVFLLSFFLITGCTSRNWYYELYDDYKIQSSYNNKVILTKNNEKININDLDYTIISFKYNSDVVCLKLDNGKYYMIYYVDTSIYGPFNSLDNLNTSTASLSMTFSSDFTSIKELEGKIYEK